MDNITTIDTEAFKERISKHFEGVTSIKEFNERRQALSDELAVEHDGKHYKTTIKGKGQITIPLYVHLITKFVDQSGLSVKLLGVGHIDPVEEEEVSQTETDFE